MKRARLLGTFEIVVGGKPQPVKVYDDGRAVPATGKPFKLTAANLSVYRALA